MSSKKRKLWNDKDKTEAMVGLDCFCCCSTMPKKFCVYKMLIGFFILVNIMFFLTFLCLFYCVVITGSSEPVITISMDRIKKKVHIYS